MSIEDFGRKYSKDVGTTIGNIQSKEGMSLVAIFAEQLANDAAEGLRAVTGKHNPSDTLSIPDKESILRMPQEDKIKMLEQYAGVVFAISIVCLEKAIVNGFFDYEDWSARYNLAITGTFLNPVIFKDKSQEAVSWKEMLGLLSKDKTFSIFFEKENMHVLPTHLRGFIDERNLAPTIREKIVPIFKPLAEPLVAKL